MGRETGEISDWVIVGGGPHAVCTGRALVAAGATVRIVEPSGRLLQRWTARTRTLAMVWMRSPLSHHLDAQPVSLHHFLHRQENADVADLAGPFRRPMHDAFLRHSEDVVTRHRLDEAVIEGRADSIRADGDHLVAAGDGFEARARRVLVATGSNVPRIPEWARKLQREGAPIRHVFEGESEMNVDLVGGGISAVQRALMVHRATGRTVRLWMRRPIRIDEFDFDRNWAKHRFFSSWSDLDEAERFEFLDRNPTEGSVPSGLAARLDRAVRRGWIRIEYGEPAVTWNAADRQLMLHSDEGAVESAGLTLVTGFEPETIPEWLRSSAETLGLPIVRGLPRLDSKMCWGREVYVCGPLARLRLGPMASNLIGARWATSLLPGVRMQPA
ncbi:MAG: FAD-dependent oxidoreductase [Planctomycetota bacterium]